MALTGPRLAGLVALAAAATALALLPPSPEYWDRPGVPHWYGPRLARVEQLERAVNRAQRRVRAAEVRDRVRAALRTTPIRPGARPQLRIAAALSPALADAMRASWDSLVMALGPYDPAAGLAVILLDAPAKLAPRHWHYLPEATDGRTCVAVVEIGDRQEPWGDRTRWLRRVLGPCAFYAAFGSPGPRLREWLDSSAMQIAYAPTWDAPGSVRRRRAVDLNAGQPLGMVERIRTAVLGRTVRTTLEETGCAAGELHACRRYLLTDELGGEWFRWSLGLPGVIPNRASLRAWHDPDVLNFLSDLVSLEGRDRFAAFWRSPATIDSAFAGAYGLSLEQWTMSWARQGGEVRVGPHVRRSSVLLSLLFVVLVVGAGAMLTTRRQVS